MTAKLFVVCCALAVASAAPGILGGIGVGGVVASPYAQVAHVGGVVASPYAQVAHVGVAAPIVRAEPIDPNPAYSFSYGVADPTTGDRKDASETLQNGVVHGSYSLVEPDGHLRRVTYTADKINGFNAVVERTGGAHAVAKVIAPQVAVAAPVARLALPGHVGVVGGVGLGGVGLGGVVANPWG